MKAEHKHTVRSFRNATLYRIQWKYLS